MTRQRGDRSKNLVGFLVGDVRYAVDIQRVREIINPLPIVELPHAPRSVLGVADHRGEVVPVVDLRQRFGLASAQETRRTKWVVVSGEAHAVGLVVDAVTDVFGTGAESERTVPTMGAADSVRGIGAVHVHEGKMVFVIDVDVVASPTEDLDFSALVTK